MIGAALKQGSVAKQPVIVNVIVIVKYVAIARKSRLSEGRTKFTWTMPSVSEFDKVKNSYRC